MMIKSLHQAKESAEEETLISSRPTQTSYLLALPSELLEYILSLVYIRNTVSFADSLHEETIS